MKMDDEQNKLRSLTKTEKKKVEQIQREQAQYFLLQAKEELGKERKPFRQFQKLPLKIAPSLREHFLHP